MQGHHCMGAYDHELPTQRRRKCWCRASPPFPEFLEFLARFLTTGEAHQATWWSIGGATITRSDYCSVLWHQPSDARHWSGQKRLLPLGTSAAMQARIPSNRSRSLADTLRLFLQHSMVDWTLSRIFSRVPRWRCECRTTCLWSRMIAQEPVLTFFQVDDPTVMLKHLGDNLRMPFSLCGRPG